MHVHSHSAHGHSAHDGHGHDHAHTHAAADFGRAFVIAIILNSAFVIIEGAYGLYSGSMALVADAGHNLSDVLGLLIAWGATLLAKKGADERFTYGFKSSSILAALLNAALLLVAVGAIGLETLRRLFDPAPVSSGAMIVVASIGILVNGFTAWLFMRGRKSDLNIRGAYLHMVADALVSVGVVVAGVLIGLTGLLWIDPLTSLVIIIVIAIGTWGLLTESVKMSLLAVPSGLDGGQVNAWLRDQPGVADVHHLHIWSLSTTQTALTAHLHMPAGHPGDAFLQRIGAELAERFFIDHATLQIEVDSAPGCAPCDSPI